MLADPTVYGAYARRFKKPSGTVIPTQPWARMELLLAIQRNTNVVIRRRATASGWMAHMGFTRDKPSPIGLVS